MKNIFNKDKYIAIGSDHAGFEYKKELVKWLNDNHFNLHDFGTYDAKSVDYPDYAHQVAEAVAKGDCSYGILLCGSANGVAITANKHENIRAALCWQNDVAEIVRKHNNANIICIPARFVSLELAKQMVTTFMETEFEGGRHATRVDKINC